MLPPGAATSGLRRRSGVTPQEEKLDMEYFELGATTLPGATLRWWSAAASMASPSACEMNAAGTPSVARLMTTSESPGTLL